MRNTKPNALLVVMKPDTLVNIGELINNLSAEFNLFVGMNKKFSKNFHSESVFKFHIHGTSRKNIRYLLKHLIGVLVYDLNKNSNDKYFKRWLSYLPKYAVILVHIIIFLKLQKFAIRLIRKLYSFCRLYSWTSKIFELYKPEIIIISPGNNKYSLEDDFIIEARKKSKLSFVLVPTWDATTNKGSWISSPNYIFVWNNLIKSTLKPHNLDSEIIIAGAPFFDKWSKIVPENNIESHKYIIYLGSSTKIIASEEYILNKLSDTIKHEFNNNIEIIYRPHPAYVETGRLRSDINLWLPKGGPISNEFLNPEALNFFKVVKNAILVTGVNTSAFLDAYLIGAPVVPLKISESLQENTEHFQMLSDLGISALTQDQLVSKIKEIQNKQITKQKPVISKVFFPYFGESSKTISNKVLNIYLHHISSFK
jgi:hypothetical protein